MYVAILNCNDNKGIYGKKKRRLVKVAAVTEALFRKVISSNNFYCIVSKTFQAGYRVTGSHEKNIYIYPLVVLLNYFQELLT